MCISRNVKEDYISKVVLSGNTRPKVTLLRVLFFSLVSRGFRAVLLYRIGRYFRIRGHRLTASFIERLIHRLCFCEISTTADIGPGFCLFHPFGLVIGANVKAGKNFNVRLDSTFGGRRGEARPDGSQYPRIGDNVTIGGGVRLLGPVDIGDNCIIGANSVVISDVPAGCVAAGAPARIIKRHGQKVSLLENDGELYDILRELITRVEKLEEQIARESENSQSC